MYDIPLKQVIDASLSKIGSVADVNTVIGQPITTPNGVTIIPFSKVSVGFASGGADYDGKTPDSDKPPHFAGGNGAGISVTPLGFLVIDKEEVRMLDLKHDESFMPAPNDPVNKTIDAINGIVDKAPSLILKIKDLFAKKDKNDADTDAKKED
ncbi:MAG: spore germination protein GerW family protein [Eubacteriales bacterium]|nr:spore germination protein GerW family protein [Eubacteriales bacterium]